MPKIYLINMKLSLPTYKERKKELVGDGSMGVRDERKKKLVRRGEDSSGEHEES